MQHVTERLQAYIDAELTPPERHRIEKHCTDCDACARELEALKTVWATVDDAAMSEAQPRLQRSLLPLLRRRLAERSRRRGDSFGAAQTLGRRPSLARAGFAVAAAIAGLAVGLTVGGPGWVSVGDGSLTENGLGDQSEAMNLLAESSNLYGGDWALDQLWLTAAGDEESGI